jgi:hypothetical protein
MEARRGMHRLATAHLLRNLYIIKRFIKKQTTATEITSHTFLFSFISLFFCFVSLSFVSFPPKSVSLFLETTAAARADGQPENTKRQQQPFVEFLFPLR